MKIPNSKNSVVLNLYDALKKLIGMTVDVVVLDRDKNVVARHSKEHNVEDDIPSELYCRRVKVITLKDTYPDAIVIYIRDDECDYV